MYSGAASPPTMTMVAAGGNRSSSTPGRLGIGHPGWFGMERRLDHLVIGPACLHQQPAAARPTAHDAVGEHHQCERLLGSPVAGSEQFLVDVENATRPASSTRWSDRLGPEEHPARASPSSSSGDPEPVAAVTATTGSRINASSSSAARETPGRTTASAVDAHSRQIGGRRRSQRWQTRARVSSRWTAAPQFSHSAMAPHDRQASSRARPVRFRTQTTRRSDRAVSRATSTNVDENIPDRPMSSDRRSITVSGAHPARSTVAGGSDGLGEGPRLE